MDLTTLARYKAANGITVTDDDAVLAVLITEVSAAVERFLGRHVEQAARTEVYDVRAHARRLFLRGWPVASSPAPQLRHDLLRLFGSGTLLGSTGYYVELATGAVSFDYELTPGDGVLQVVYTSGMAASADAFAAAYPEIEGWVVRQVAHQWQRRASPGATSRGGAQGGTLSYDGSLELLPGLVRACRSYRGWRFGA